MSNIAEGNERGSTQEYYRFLAIAKASCAEVRSLLYVALDCGSVSKEAFNEHLHLTERTGQVIGALRMSLSRRMSNGKRP
jgi:four helix bundle protein